MSKYQLVETTDYDLWDELVDKSDEGTVFSYSNYLDALDQPFKLLLIYKNQEVKGGVHLMLSKDSKDIILDDFVIYSGFLFMPFGTDQRRSKVLSERFKMIEFVTEELAQKYQKIELSLSPAIRDIRPILWHNYHGEEKDKYKVDIRFTSYLDVKDLKKYEEDIESSDLFKNFEVIRQRNIRKAIKRKSVFSEENHVDLFIDFYKHLMTGQDQIVSQQRLEIMKNLIVSLLESKLAKMYVGKDENGEIGYITIFSIDNKRAYYLFGAGHPSLRDQYLGTFTFFSAFMHLSKQGIKEIDLEGVNSPSRGAFKLSFGGQLVQYVEIYKG